MLLRAERAGDREAVRRVVAAAFGRTDEARLVERLRADGEAAISRVAEVADEVIGHVLLSPMAAPFRALALAPLAVAPAWQGRGVGAALVRDALKDAAAQGWRGVFVLGDPSYYLRFGFQIDLARGFESPFAGPHFMALPLGGELPSLTGPVRHAAAFFEDG